MSPVPRNFSISSGDCDVGVFLDSLMSTSIHSLCSTETQPRVSPSYPMNNDLDGTMNKEMRQQETSAPDTSAQRAQTLAPTPKRPSLPTKGSTFRDRMKGLSVIMPPSPADVHAKPPTCPAPLRRNVELQKKLSERHFLFRPVSEDDQSKASSSYHTKSATVTRAEF